jgi:hypothetical protein
MIDYHTISTLIETFLENGFLYTFTSNTYFATTLKGFQNAVTTNLDIKPAHCWSFI